MGNYRLSGLYPSIEAKFLFLNFNYQKLAVPFQRYWWEIPAKRENQYQWQIISRLYQYDLQVILIWLIELALLQKP